LSVGRGGGERGQASAEPVRLEKRTRKALAWDVDEVTERSGPVSQGGTLATRTKHECGRQNPREEGVRRVHRGSVDSDRRASQRIFANVFATNLFGTNMFVIV